MRKERQKTKYNNLNYSTAQRAKYGQNYIKDPSLVKRLLEMTTVNDDDIVLEVGPGHGIFTTEIIKKAGQLITIEIDEQNIEVLKRKFDKEIKDKQLEVIHKDALLFEYRWAQTTTIDKHYKIVASIPYSISSELFKKFLLKKPMPSDAWFTVQREFAHRVLGPTPKQGFGVGGGLLSVLVNSFYKGKIIHEFAREDFSPVPSVDSVFLQLQARNDVPELVVLNFGKYKDFVRGGFIQPINTVQKHFKDKISANKLQQLSDKCKFKLKDQTTELNESQWKSLFVESLA